MEDLISVVVPAYNVEKYISECIDSILKQSYKNIEVILVDDGSTDNTSSICEQYKSNYNNVLLVTQSNGGLSAARNAGINVASGTYICFIDSDDYIDSFMLEQLHNAIVNNNADIAICGIQKVTELGEPTTCTAQDLKNGVYSSADIRLLGNLTIRGYWTYTIACNKLFKKSIFNDCRFYNGRIIEDEIIFDDIMDRCQTIATIADKLYYYRERETSITSTKNLKVSQDRVFAYCKRSKWFFDNGFSMDGKKILLMGYKEFMKIIKNYDYLENQLVFKDCVSHLMPPLMKTDKIQALKLMIKYQFKKMGIVI